MAPSRTTLIEFVGNIASIVVMDVFKKRFGLSKQSADEYANTKGWIVSIATAGAVFGCLTASFPPRTASELFAC